MKGIYFNDKQVYTEPEPWNKIQNIQITTFIWNYVMSYVLRNN